jgi:DNA-binding IclR family transcriptional regulator
MAQALDPVMGARGAQTLMRGIDLLDIVAHQGPLPLKTLTERLGLTRSTTHRLASALTERDYLRLDAGGYRLGPKLLELDDRARHFRTLPTLARPHLERLATEQSDPVNLAVHDAQRVRYVDQVRGSRRIEIRSVIGETRALASTALGRALILDRGEDDWLGAFQADPDSVNSSAADDWLARMRLFKAMGATLDIEENDDKVRCVAAPIRGPDGGVVAAISLSSLPQYMDDARMQALIEPVKAAARAISFELGWNGD